MVDINTGLIALAAGLSLGVSAIATAMAEKQIGAAAVGAMAEKEGLFGKGLILTVIPETIVIFGLVVAILIIGMAGGA
ncbi:MAG: V-type ATP synthase subunit K [Candidatus Woesearchaeota archaeon]|nr:V-type ATP synthase subunit K [Candidatus Woesearchaeota archaeon]